MATCYEGRMSIWLVTALNMFVVMSHCISFVRELALMLYRAVHSLAKHEVAEAVRSTKFTLGYLPLLLRTVIEGLSTWVAAISHQTLKLTVSVGY